MTDTAVKHADAPARRRINYLPYLLSLPALLVCIGILIPFVTAVYYSLQRYRLNLPMMRGFIWFQNYIDFFTDSEFWHTVQVSLEYTVLTVGVELVFGLGIAMLLQKQTRINNIVSILLLLPLMTAPAIAALMWKLMTNPNFGVLSYFVQLLGFNNFKWASDPSTALFTVVLVDVWVYTPFIMILLLAGLRSLADPAVRSRGARRRSKAVRLLSDHAADADALHHHRRAVPDARFDPAIRHHLSDDSRRARQHAACLPGPRLSRILPVYERGQVGCALIILWAITYALSNVFIKQWLKLRERARGLA